MMKYELYQSIAGKEHREEGQSLDAVCHLCCLHQQTSFTDGIQFGIRLAQELNNP